jgi:putative ATP-dependent endonuclease of OLD family
VRAIEETRTGTEQDALVDELKTIKSYDDFGERCEEYGVFSNRDTLEIDLFEGGYAEAIIETMRETPLGKERRAWVDEWEADSEPMDPAKFLSIIDYIGKGRFAQRLATRIEGLTVPPYIQAALKFVADRV